MKGSKDALHWGRHWSRHARFQTNWLDQKMIRQHWNNLCRQWQDESQGRGTCVHGKDNEKNHRKNSRVRRCDMEMYGYVAGRKHLPARYSMALHNASAVGSLPLLLQRHLPISIIKQAVADKKPRCNFDKPNCRTDVQSRCCWLHSGKITAAITGTARFVAAFKLSFCNRLWLKPQKGGGGGGWCSLGAFL